MNLKRNAAVDDSAVEAVAESSNKRVLVAGGVAAGIAVVAVMSYVLLSGGSDDVPMGVVAAPQGTVVKQQPTAAPTKAVAAPAIKKFTGKNARDPFKPLVVEPVAAAPAPSATTTAAATTGTTSGGTTGSTSGGTTGSTGTSPVATTAPKSAEPVTIKLVSVASTDAAANFTLNATAYKGVKPQATFGTYFKLLNLTEGKCGAVQYGDVTFEMCEGDSLTLR